MHPTIHSRPRCDRLEDRTQSGWWSTALLVALLLVVTAPVTIAGLFALLGWRLARVLPDHRSGDAVLAAVVASRR
jgi:hypothetical protein